MFHPKILNVITFTKSLFIECNIPGNFFQRLGHLAEGGCRYSAFHRPKAEFCAGHFTGHLPAWRRCPIRDGHSGYFTQYNQLSNVWIRRSSKGDLGVADPLWGNACKACPEYVPMDIYIFEDSFGLKKQRSNDKGSARDR